MAKTAKEKELEKQMAEAEAKKAGEIAQAQIEVYEGQNYEAKNAYQEAKSKRGTARSKLPEEIPTDPYYKERLLEAQYIKANISSPEHSEEHKHVASYTAEIKKQQKAKSTIQVLDKQMPQLYASAVAESKAVETKAEKAKVAETKSQEELITGFQTAIVTEQKAEAKRVADEKARVAKEAKDLADERQARADKFYADGGKLGKNASKKLHYSLLGGTIQRGDIIPVYYASAGRSGTGFDISDRYYQEVSQRIGITVAQARQASAVGARTQSGKARDSFIRSVQDPSGKKEADYQASRAQAKKNVASAYGSMSAQERLSSSAMASTYATSPEIKKADQLTVLSEMTGGLLGKKKYQVAEGDTMRVYETDTLGTRKDVTAQVMPIIIKQREIELANRRQQEYVKELRAGNIGTANALSSPQTTQSYTGTSTVNLKTFLKERGLVAKTAPDSMFKPDYSEKLEKARAQTKVSGEMGDLRTASPMFVGKTNQSYQMKRADYNEIYQRKLAQQGVAIFDPIIPTIDDLGKGKMIATTMNPVSFTDVKLEKKDQPLNYNPSGMPTGNQWVVTTTEKQSIPTMSGGVFQVDAPVKNIFDTQMEAKIFAKKNQPKVFSGTDNELFNRFNYASAVDSGEVIHPSKTPTWRDDIHYYSNVVHRPLLNLGSTVANLALPQDKQIPISEVASGHLIGGTIDDILKGDPLKGSGVSSAYEYTKEDPLRTALELPAEALVWVTGGKAIQLGTKGFVAGKTALSQANYIPQVVKTVGTKIESGVTVIQKAPEKVWIKSTKMDSGLGKSLLEVDKKLAYVGGQRTGFTTAMNLRYTFGGRKFLREAKDRSFTENPQPTFAESGLFGGKINDPVIIKNKDILDIPKQYSDEGMTHLRGSVSTNSPAVKVGSVQQYYKTATSSFTNVPKQGLRLPKAPKLPSFNSARNWIAKTKSNVKLVEEKGYSAMSSGGEVKLKVVEKSQKVKDNILDAKKIAKAEAEGKLRDAKLLAKGKQYQAEKQIDEMIQAGKKKVDPLSNQARQNNAWGKLSKFKAESKIKIGEMKKSITDRPATKDVLMYREVKTTGASKSIIKSMPEGLSVSATPIKTVRTQTKTPTDYTTGLGKKKLVKGDMKPEVVFENKTPVMYTGKVDKEIPIIGEQVKIPYKDLKTVETYQGGREELLETGSYKILEKGKYIEKKVEVKALQQEDADKTFQQRNTLTGTGEKIQESSVREWDGTKSDVILGSLQKKVLTTKLSPLPKKDPPSKVIYKSMTQNDSGAVFTAESVTGNPMTGKTGGYGKVPDEVYSKMSSDGTVSVSINKISSAPIKGSAKKVHKEFTSTLKGKSPYNSAYIGSAVGEITFTSSVLTPKDMIKTGVDTNTSSITGVQSKIDTKVDTGMSQDSAQKLNTDTASRLKTRTGLKSKLNIKLDTGLKTQQMTATIPLLKSPVLKTTHKKAVVLPIILPREELKVNKTRRGKRGKKAGFIGNVRLDNIMGMYKRKEITYGKKKVSKLERQDMRLTAKTSNRISMPASGLLKTKKKKKKKTESILGRSVTKTKDEFSGFALSKTKPVKRKKTKRITL